MEKRNQNTLSVSVGVEIYTWCPSQAENSFWRKIARHFCMFKNRFEALTCIHRLDMSCGPGLLNVQKGALNQMGLIQNDEPISNNTNSGLLEKIKVNYKGGWGLKEQLKGKH